MSVPSANTDLLSKLERLRLFWPGDIIDGLNASLAFGGCRFPQCINLLLFPLDGAPQQLLVLSLLLVKLTQQPEMQTQSVTQQKVLALEALLSDYMA